MGRCQNIQARGFTLALKPRADVNRNLKRVPVAHKKDKCPPKDKKIHLISKKVWLGRKWKCSLIYVDKFIEVLSSDGNCMYKFIIFLFVKL